MTEVRVRLAAPEDEDAVLRLLVKLDSDNSIGFPYHEERVRESIRMGTEAQGGYIGVIDAPDRPGEIAGSVGLHWSQPWYSYDFFFHEVWLFVDPAYRKGTGYGDALMKFSQDLKARMNAISDKPVPFFTSVSSRKNLAKKMRWWGRRGEFIGAIYLLK